MAGIRFAAGILSDLARWRSVTARLRGARKDFDGTVKAWEQAVTISKHVVSLPQVETAHGQAAVADMLRGLAAALWECDRRQDAAAAWDERRRILEAVGIPETPAESEPFG